MHVSRLNTFRAVSILGAASAAVVLCLTSATLAGAATVVGGKCTRAGTKSGSLVCTKSGSSLVWKAASGSAGTSAAASTAGIGGSWKASSKSVVGYRVKEVLFGQSAEAVGRSNGLTGTMTIAGTKVTAVDLSVDLTTLKSDSGRRDGQVQTRILDTAKFPKAQIKLAEPIDFGKVPADQEQVTRTAKVDLTLRGVTKRVSFDVTGRRNGATIEIVGSTVITFADYSIPNPSNQAAQVGSTGTLEFATVFTR
jgi:polyisoprenoid-binding protein YceI